LGKTKKMFHKKERGIFITRLMARDGCNCKLCEEPLDRHIKNSDDDMYITFDHIIARSKGGMSELKNFQLAHRHCNEARGNDPILPGDEGFGWLFMNPSTARA
jgi:5-methylcytosine-specific restriction endonuclease McrA